jgi:hypothetical protein
VSVVDLRFLNQVKELGETISVKLALPIWLRQRGLVILKSKRSKDDVPRVSESWKSGSSDQLLKLARHSQRRMY